MARTKTGRTIAAVIILIGAVLLIAALFMPWYSYEFSEAGAGVTQNSYPGLPSQNGTIQYSCTGNYQSTTGHSCPSQTSYTSISPKETNTGNIAESGFFLLIVGFIVGIISTIFGFMSRGNARRASPAIWFAIIAVILAIITPVLFMAALPGAISSDISSAYRPSSSGPWSGFMGSTSGTIPVSPTASVPFTSTWGPAIGWYFAFVAFVVLLIGLVLLFLWRKEPPQPAAAAPPSATTAPPSGPAKP